jgi:5-formyltetrahydrofolate cyclo-ligase
MQVSKDHIRKTILAKRLAMASDARADAAQKIIPELLRSIPAAAVVAGYHAIKNELDIFPAMQALSARGNALCLPVIEHKESPLVFHAWQLDQALIKGSYGIDIPKDGREVTPDIILVPLMAFDARGHRIGYGAGYYDETIRTLRRAKKNITCIGIAYDFQRVEQVPAEGHDEILDKVIAV